MKKMCGGVGERLQVIEALFIAFSQLILTQQFACIWTPCSAVFATAIDQSDLSRLTQDRL